jgi:hypothetical protein
VSLTQGQYIVMESSLYVLYMFPNKILKLFFSYITLSHLTILVHVHMLACRSSHYTSGRALSSCGLAETTPVVCSSLLKSSSEGKGTANANLSVLPFRHRLGRTCVGECHRSESHMQRNGTEALFSKQPLCGLLEIIPSYRNYFRALFPYC